MLRAAGVEDRVEIVGGSFFAAIPSGADAWVLKSVLHDWDDDRCLDIMRACRAAMRPGATLLVVERDLGGPNEAAEAKLIDLTMLVVLGGKERSAREYANLFEAAGFRFAGVTPSASGTSIFEAVASAANSG